MLRLFGVLFLGCMLQGAEMAEDPEAAARELFPDRDRIHTLKLREVARHMRLEAGSTVADVGCGTGEIALVLSRATGPQGRVFAEDIDKRSLADARRLMKKHKARHVTVLAGTPKDPLLPAGSLDAILLLGVYHELEEYPDMLAKMRSALKPGGRLVIIDPMPRKTLERDREVQMKNHVLNPARAEKDLRSNGFAILHREDRFLDPPDEEGTQWLLVAEPQ